MVIPGIEGSEGITNIAISLSKRFLAVCERAERALCIVYDLYGINQIPALQPKRRKILTSNDFQAKEFVSVSFSPSSEKHYLVTLTAAAKTTQQDTMTPTHGDCKVIVWLWEKAKCFAMASIPCNDMAIPSQVSFNPTDHNILVVTGMHTFKYLKILESNTVKFTQHSIVKKDGPVSTDYTCHAWLPDARMQ